MTTTASSNATGAKETKCFACERLRQRTERYETALAEIRHRFKGGARFIANAALMPDGHYIAGTKTPPPA